MTFLHIFGPKSENIVVILQGRLSSTLSITKDTYPAAREPTVIEFHTVTVRGSERELKKLRIL